VESLVSVFKNPAIAKNQQVLYVAGFSLWLLSFNDPLIPKLKEADITRALVDTVKTVTREKVVRICFSVLYNLLTRSGADGSAAAEEDKKKEGEPNHVEGLERKAEGSAQNLAFSFAEDMIGLGLHRAIENLLTRKWKDNDVVVNMEFIQSKLRYVLRQLSSFDRYAAEANSGHLQQSPVHSEDFWKENFAKFSTRQFYLIQTLVGLLDSDDETTLEMACFDLGEFARYHPDGRRVIAHHQGKLKLMPLMNHPNSNVAKQALLSVQKLMLTNWEQLNRSAKGGLAGLSKGGR